MTDHLSTSAAISAREQLLIQVRDLGGAISDGVQLPETFRQHSTSLGRASFGMWPSELQVAGKKIVVLAEATDLHTFAKGYVDALRDAGAEVSVFCSWSTADKTRLVMGESDYPRQPDYLVYVASTLFETQVVAIMQSISTLKPKKLVIATAMYSVYEEMWLAADMECIADELYMKSILPDPAEMTFVGVEVDDEVLDAEEPLYLGARDARYGIPQAIQRDLQWLIPQYDSSPADEMYQSFIPAGFDASKAVLIYRHGQTQRMNKNGRLPLGVRLMGLFGFGPAA